VHHGVGRIVGRWTVVVVARAGLATPATTTALGSGVPRAVLIVAFGITVFGVAVFGIGRV